MAISQSKQSNPASFAFLSALILVPLGIMAAMAWLGLVSQRAGALTDAQREARLWLERAAERLPELLEPKGVAPTLPLRLPQPPAAISPQAEALQKALSEKNTAALLELATEPGLTAAGIPVGTLAAISALEMGQPATGALASMDSIEKFPSLLTSRWLTALGPGELQSQAQLQWQHDETLRQALWDEQNQAWKSAPSGPYGSGESVCWLLEPVSPESAAVRGLTASDLRGRVARWLSADSQKPLWLGMQVKLQGVPLTESIAAAEPALATLERRFQLSALLQRPELLYAGADRFARWTLALLGISALSAVLGLWLIHRTLTKERRLNELKSQFVSSVSHELRAPVGSLRLMADALQQGTVQGPQVQEFFRLMSQEGARLSSLIENVLDFARIEQNRRTYTLAETDLNALIEDSIRLMTPQAQAREITIQADLPPLREIVNVDAPAMQQALINLLDNAIKFSPLASVVQVSLTENLTSQHWSLAVSDHGPGIPKSEHERIFERFYRLGNELKRETQGAGIGLSLVQHIVHGHGGTISVENAATGTGSIFTMTIPFSSCKS